jgi:glyoxylase-like metal-dependent hydrolase (beta-lactamase superfamily II)
MFHRDEAKGINRIGEHFLNFYRSKKGGRITIVDTGLPASWDSLLEALSNLGSTPADVEALVLTHAHFDHIGFAERALASIERPGEPGAVTLLPGHRQPWIGVAGRAVMEARGTIP